MVLLPVDEAYAFDYLAILHVKALHGMKVQDSINVVSGALRNACPQFEKIANSAEFNDLYHANLRTFDMVQRATTDACKASEVDRANCLRTAAKQALQAKFFGGNISECKTKRPQ